MSNKGPIEMKKDKFTEYTCRNEKDNTSYENYDLNKNPLYDVNSIDEYRTYNDINNFYSESKNNLNSTNDYGRNNTNNEKKLKKLFSVIWILILFWLSPIILALIGIIIGSFFELLDSL